FCSGFRMRCAAPFAGHASVGPPAAAHVRDADLRGGHLGLAAKADDLQLKVGRASSGGQIAGQFDCGRIVNWKTDSPERIFGACQNLLFIGPVSAERFMTAASIW